MKMTRKSLWVFFLLLVTLCLTQSSYAAYDARYELGTRHTLAFIDPVYGEIYVNSWGRAYLPSLSCWGEFQGYAYDGSALVQVDAWNISDVLGEDYYLLAYTEEKGCCYANQGGLTYTPGSNELGMMNGRDGLGRAQITVLGTIYVQPTQTYTYTYTTYPLQTYSYAYAYAGTTMNPGEETGETIEEQVPAQPTPVLTPVASPSESESSVMEIFPASTVQTGGEDVRLADSSNPSTQAEDVYLLP